MPHNLELWCCPHFRREVEAVVAASPELNGLRVNSYPFPCLQGPRKLRDAKAAFAFCLTPGASAVIGGSCLLGARAEPEGLAGAAVLSPSQCFHLVAPSALIDDLLAGGAYLLTPGWLEHWRSHIKDWGFDQETARQFFQETTRYLALLDTGTDGGSQAEMEEMSEYLGLPWRRVPVGLDMLTFSLERLVLDLRRRGKAPLPQDRDFADHLMLVDLMSEVLTAEGEQEALARVEAIFGLLFAPGRLVYTPPAGPGEDRPPAAERDFAWTASGRGFVVHLRHGGLELGALELDDLAFAEYKDRYLALARPLARLCALALANARAQEARRKAEQAMRNMASIVESSEDAIIGQGLDGLIASWNKGAQRAFGYAEADVMGRHISFLVPPDRPDDLPRLLDRIKEGQTVEQVDTVWLTKDGRQLAVSLQLSPICDESGQVVGASSIARDVTKEKEKADAQRRDLEARLQQAQKLESVGRLAGGVAHDFNNMLAIILGYAEMALERTAPGDEQRADLEQIFQAAERAKGLTRQLLAFARKQVLEMTDLKLDEVVTNFSKMIKRLIGEDIEIKIVLEEGLPLVKADASMLEQVLLNLAVNARDAMPDGGTLTIETKAAHLDHNHASRHFEVTPGDYVMLAVTDTGKGMDEETRQMIFEPFFTTKTPGKGTGLGLSTVYGIVRQHGGGIWVYSELGQGSTFKIFFPAVAASEGERVKPVLEPPPPPGGETILVVEDDGGLREFICAALTKLGYNVLCAGAPVDALQLSERYTGTIHLVLTDVVLPEMNGKALHDSLAFQRPGLEALFMSGYTENVIAHRGVLKQGVNFIQKPFAIKQLAQKIGTILAGRAPRRP